MIDKLSDIIIRSIGVDGRFTGCFGDSGYYIIFPNGKNIVAICNELFIKFLDTIGIPKNIYKKHRKNLLRQVIKKLNIKPTQDTIIQVYNSIVRDEMIIIEEFTYNGG